MRVAFEPGGDPGNEGADVSLGQAELRCVAAQVGEDRGGGALELGGERVGLRQGREVVPYGLSAPVRGLRRAAGRTRASVAELAMAMRIPVTEEAVRAMGAWPWRAGRGGGGVAVAASAPGWLHETVRVTMRPSARRTRLRCR